MSMLGTSPNPVEDLPDSNGTVKSTRPDVDAHLKDERARLAEEQRKVTTTQSAIERTMQKLAELREDLRVYSMFVEGRQKHIDTVERLKAKQT
jgi:hypothetical protein